MKGERVFVYLALFAIFIATITATDREEYKGHQVIKYEINSQRYLEFLEDLENTPSLLHFYEIWHEKKVNGETVQFDIQVKNEETKRSIEEIAYLKQIKLKEIEIIHSDLGKDILNNLNENFHSKLADPSFFSAYRTLTEINQFLSDLEIQFPGFVKLFSIGQSIEGRDIYGITISSPSGSSDKPQIVYNSCQHAREWISPMTTTYVAYYLLANYTTNSTVQSLLDSFEIFYHIFILIINERSINNKKKYSIVPVVNVDGYEFTWSNDRLWRKNRREDERCYGVDNNRNWGYEWGLDSGSSPNQCSETYRGSAAFSEPEQTSLSLYISSLPNVIAYIDFHSYGYDFVWAWGYSSQLPPNNAEMQALGLSFVNAVEVVHGTTWTAGNSNTAIYPTSGSAPDWTFGQEGIIYSYTCELRGNSFILPPSDILLSGSEIFEGVVAMGLYLQNI